jgi:hypothetical protein
MVGMRYSLTVERLQMNIVEHMRDNLAKLATLGRREREEARQDGISSYYIDPVEGSCIIEEKPDGAKVERLIASREARDQAAE